MHLASRRARASHLAASRSRISIEDLIDLLSNGECAAVLVEDQSLSPTKAAAILGIARSLVALRMDNGDLRFHYVGRRRRIALKDIKALKTRLDAR